MINYAELLKQIRRSKGLTQKALADVCGLSQGMIAGIEIGKYDKPNLETVQALVTKLGVNPNAFIYPTQNNLFIPTGYQDELEYLRDKASKYEQLIDELYAARTLPKGKKKVSSSTKK